MSPSCVARFAAIGCCLIGIAALQAGDWPQFRGPNAVGLAVNDQPLPAEISPEKHVAWKAETPAGHSSPVVVGERIFLTGVEEDKLVTFALDRGTGKRLWTQTAPHEKLEEIHRIGSHAQSTSACDGEIVVSFFGSSGLYAYDVEGKPLWSRPMGPFKNDFGAASSPILVDDFVILCQDHDVDSFMTAINKRTGETVWSIDRSEFPRNYCTPVVWEVDGRKQLVVAATLRIVGYDLQTGEEQWTVRGIARFISTTPVVGQDNQLYVAGWAAGGDETEQIRLGPQAPYYEKLDANKDGFLQIDEIPDGEPIKQRFKQVDRDKSGGISAAEYDFFRKLFDSGRNLIMAVKPGAKGDASQTHVAWTYNKVVPFCSSPVFTDGLLFAVKDGGILSVIDTKTGKPTRQGRLSGTGEYYASPVAGDGKVYCLSDEGKLTVVSAEADWSELATADFGEDVYATPAIVDGRIYLRTKGHVYCFSK